MKFAVVHDWLVNPGGSEEVLRDVLEIYPGVLFTSQFNPAKFDWLQGVEVRTSFVQRLPFALTKHYIYAPLVSFVYPKFDLSEFDVVLSDSHSFAHGVRKRTDALHVNYYHTPARSLWLPEIDPRASGFLARMFAGPLRERDLAASKRPDVILANSKTTAQRIERFYGRKVDRVIFPPVKTSKFSDVVRSGEDEGFLMWGRLVEYKRVDLAIDAAKKHGFRLNIVGSGPCEPKLKRQSEGAENVIFHGRLDDGQLKVLMSRSKAVLFPAYEDFGIVPVEAMAAGLPVIAYGAGGASETVSSECGAIMKEQTVQSLLEAVAQFERRTFDPAVLRARAALYDEEVFRKEYKATVEAAIERHAKPR